MPIERSSEELVDLVARCWFDAERLTFELGACGDTAHDALDTLCDRDYPNPVGAVLARVFELWLGDEWSQEWQRDAYDLRVRMRRHLDELGWDPDTWGDK